jgi:5-methylcytosine-specific restriction endonuclease McrA
MPVWPTSGRSGFCRWCGEGIYHTKGPRAGETNSRRGWHDGRDGERNCLLEFYLHTRREVQVRHVIARDGEKCWDCGEAPEKWIKNPKCPTGIWRPFRARDDDRVEFVGTYYPIRRASALEFEHTVPLWSVAHLPADERRKFFHVDNARMRCPDCHSRKTAQEAGRRAHTERLRKETVGEAKEKKPFPKSRGFAPKGSGPKLKGRGFDKGHRPMRRT